MNSLVASFIFHCVGRYIYIRVNKHEVCNSGHIPTKLFYSVFLGVSKVFPLCFHISSCNFGNPLKRYCTVQLQILNTFFTLAFQILQNLRWNSGGFDRLSAEVRHR